jgi:4-alpha-glucanotransferase
VDYEATLSTKLSIARKIFNLEKDKVLNSSSFKQFLAENGVYLLSYCLSCVIMVLDFLFHKVYIVFAVLQ